MSYQGDWSDDYLYWDNTEAVTAYVTTPNAAAAGVDPTTTTVSIAIAFRGDISKLGKDLGDVLVETDTQEWSIPYALLGAYSFTQGDKIVDADDVTWIVDSSVLNRIGSSKLYHLAQTHKKQFADEL